MEINIILHAFVILTTFVAINNGFSKTNQDETSKELKNSKNLIQVNNLPKFLTQNCQLNITFGCSNDSYILLRLEVEGLRKKEFSLLKRYFLCKPYFPAHTKLISIHLPNNIAYKPSWNNNYKNYIDNAHLRIWIVPVKKKWINYELSTTKWQGVLEVPKPFDRPAMPERQCGVWWKAYVGLIHYTPVCAIELETIRILSYPLALSGERVGLVKKLEPYQDLALLRKYKNEMEDSSFTFIMWLYLTDYCPKATLCSLMHHVTWDDKYYSPLLLINKKGQLHIEVFMKDRTSLAYLSHSSLHKNKWILLVLSCENSKVLRVDVKYAPDYEAQLFLTISLPAGIFFKDSMGNLVFGGSDLQPSFRGYFGDIILHRRMAVSISQIRIPPEQHPMFQLRLQEQDYRCGSYKKKVLLYWKQVEGNYREKKIWKKMCKSLKKDFTEINYLSKHLPPQCSAFQNGVFRRQYAFVASYIKQRVSSRSSLNYEELSDSLLSEVHSIIENKGLSQMPKIIWLLKQSSCYGNHDSAYMLATIFNYGLSVQVQEILAHSYLLRSCISLNRLSLLSMANKHTLGIDGIPLDYDQAYVYYMTAAMYTLQDLSSHRDKDTLTELVRLTDESKMVEHGGEEGHLFQWFRQQAARGVVGAQQRMASLLYWGAKGVNRNITTASSYYKEAATTGNPNSVHDYAVILLKGHGVKQNITKAVELLEQGASQNYSRSCNTLGWYYLVHVQNYTLAAEYLEKAFHLGDPDAGHNLAHMLLTAKYPGVPRVERKMAWEFISKAALRGNKESGVLVAKYNMLGHVSILRNPHLSIIWSRHMSEKNPAIGKLLKSGVKAYRLKNWEASLFYYLMAANSGTEVASFNLAFLCDENHEYLSSNMGKECAYRHFNFSSLRSSKKDNSYAWLKMADYFYQQDNITLATSTYAAAAINGDPQGLFNLGLLVEEGRRVPDDVWKSLNVPFNTSRHKLSLLHHIYTRCRDSRGNDAYLPCLLALARVQILWTWIRYQAWLISSLLAGTVMMLVFKLTRLRRQTRSLLENEI